jgi:hypothetical protein
LACKLLLTAARRQHAAAVQTLISEPAVLQHMDAWTLEAVLRQLLANGSVIGSACFADFFESLCVRLLHPQLPAVVALNSEVLARLLLAAVEASANRCVQQLCLLPAAQQLSSNSMAQLVKAASSRLGAPHGASCLQR